MTNQRIALLSTEIASRREIRLALSAIVISSIFFLTAIPFARQPLEHISAFVPVYVTAFIICDLITAVLLFNHFYILRSWALLILAGSYLFTAFITLSYALMFPGLFSATGLLSAGGQSTSAMYMFWHAGFPIAVIWYALSKKASSDLAAKFAHPHIAVFVTVGVVVGVVSGYTFFVTFWQDKLPVFIQGDRTTDLGHAALSSVWILCFGALAVLWRRRPCTVIDLWLIVVICAWLFDIALSAVLNGGRYDLGWYCGRIYGLLAAAALLILLLIENGRYYSYLVRTSEQLSYAHDALERQTRRTAADLRRFRGLLEAAPDPMVVVDPGGHITLLNLQAEMQFGYAHDELLGQEVTTIIPEGFGDLLIASRERWPEGVLEAQFGGGVELCGRRRDESTFPIEVMLSPLESAEGELITVALRDITSRKKVEAELLNKMDELNRSNEELEQFAYVASHDLQEPLRMVASYMKLLSRRYTGKLGADADDFIGFAVDGATRMQRLIQDLLAYSRVSSKGRALKETSGDKALQEALGALRGAITESGALVTHDALPMVMADEVQLTQLFQNLVGNAIKYQQSDIPKVHVAVVKTSETKWMFSVQDNGIGIRPEHFGRIFGMFQRLHQRDEFDGTGIGLAICKKIVERHGGDLSVESQFGQGSSFSFGLTACLASLNYPLPGRRDTDSIVHDASRHIAV
jgi:PAS domain S-box-containing protein